MAKDGSRDSRGIVQVYTGSGKGKTSAAWGQALRAAGHGWKVAVVRFMKPGASGEVNAAARLAPEISVFGKTSPYDPTVNQRESAVLREESRENFRRAVELIGSAEYDLIVLDELNIVLHYGFVSEQELFDVLHKRAGHVGVVITGRYAPQWLLEAADLVTEMVDVKHPSAEGAAARAGIEY